jgi:hypothetical protein
MKKLIIVSALSLVVSAQAFAAGSKITNSTIKNKADISNSTNTAGAKSEANMGTIKLKNAEVKNSTISNDATIRNSTNRASGGTFLKKGGKANMGSVVVE